MVLGYAHIARHSGFVVNEVSRENNKQQEAGENYINLLLVQKQHCSRQEHKRSKQE